MKEIRAFLEEDLMRFEQTFNGAVSSNVSLLDKIMKYIVKTKGKQLRPMFVILSAKLFGDTNEATFRAASLIELLHTATLVHDDVVDDSNQRRGFFSINALWKNKIAVLVGDYLLSKGLLLSLSNGDFHILEILATAVKEMSEGELLQIEKARKLDISEAVYFEIIRCKTASLISSACGAGSFSTTQDQQTTDLMKQFGEKVGIAFQIKDDLFDYGKVDVGKPTGNDIKEKKMTLPLIYTLNNCDSVTKAKIIHIFKNANKKKQEVRYIIDVVTKSGGISYAERQMKNYIDEAFLLLDSFPPTTARNYLKELVNYTIERNY
ncbi:MAG: polyprenyl synthetase family protein [Bacteroidetes bacterium]|nr:polyprenyl synthetase family protein [Bacteroidota bacterium]MBP6314885.1 polyprenyl synthetase family protein [Chitinophagaceae bacterium]